MKVDKKLKAGKTTKHHEKFMNKKQPGPSKR